MAGGGEGVAGERPEAGAEGNPSAGPPPRAGVLILLPLVAVLAGLLAVGNFPGTGWRWSAPSWSLAVLGGASAAVLVVFLLHARRALRTGSGRGLTAACLLATLAAGGGSLPFLLLGTHPCIARARAADGTVYELRTRDVLFDIQGDSQEVTLSKVVLDAGFLAFRRNLAVCRNSHLASYLVRPEGHGRGIGPQIHFAPDGFVAGFRRGMACNVGWDPVAELPHVDEGNCRGGLLGNAEAIPPFRLLGASGIPAAEDLATLRRMVAFRVPRSPLPGGGPGGAPQAGGGGPSGTGSGPGRDAGYALPFALRQAVLVSAAGDDNPAVRAAARDLMEAGGPYLYPGAPGR